MNLALVLTKQCNLRCRYCFETHENVFISEETALRAVDLAVSDGCGDCNISFFGGEPLLRRELIERCVHYAKEKYPDVSFRFNMTTNGLLLDEEFLRFAGENGLRIAFSHDGMMSRVNRLRPDGRDALRELDEKLALYLRWQPKNFVMATVTPDCAAQAADSVISLFGRGAARVNLAPDDRPDAGWNDGSMDEMKRQFARIADYILDAFREGRNVALNNFDEKILSITKRQPCHVCRLGYRKLYVDWDGALYPCIQFGGIAEYRIGSVTEGVDERARRRIYARSLAAPSFCKGCAMAERCVNHCACLNFQQCGDMGEVSAAQCRWQQTVIAAADALAVRMLECSETEFLRRYAGK